MKNAQEMYLRSSILSIIVTSFERIFKKLFRYVHVILRENGIFFSLWSKLKLKQLKWLINKGTVS